jgi:AraC family transcriptional regulator of adaptative response/methylated-DNA-[protein]-cysteine methyltransferase
MSHYERIARVIRYLDEHHVERPALHQMAAYAGVSPFHFHRLFTAWAGVTPKEFLQCLTLAHVKRLLCEGQSVLDAAMAVGFSGPGRLHDLCVKFVAASPGELKACGHGWQIVFGFTESPFGDCLLAEGPRGICHIGFGERSNRMEATEMLQKAWPAAELGRDDGAIARLAADIFQTTPGKSSRATIRAMIRGSEFQVRVWKALLHVPPGSLVTYGKLAAAIGQPSAARAVGGAVGANPLAFLIPCHRVIRETGVIGEYRWGQMRKRVMIAWETAPGREHDPAVSPMVDFG